MDSGRGAAGGGLSREDCKCRAGQRRQEWGWVSQEEPVMEKHSRCVYSRAGGQAYTVDLIISSKSRFNTTMLRMTGGPADTIHRKRSQLFA